MPADLKGFWHRFQSGVEVAVAGTEPEVLLGVREGCLRLFHDGLDRPVPVAVVPQDEPEVVSEPLLSCDDEVVGAARARACALRDRLGGAYHFYVAAVAGLHALEFGGRTHHFVRSWASVVSVAGESIGSSGSIEIPERLVAGLDRDQVAVLLPGTRRGGLIGVLTGGLEGRRSATAQATFHALASLFHGVLESAPIRRRP